MNPKSYIKAYLLIFSGKLILFNEHIKAITKDFSYNSRALFRAL